MRGGQVTLFVLLGLVMLILVGIFVAVMQTSSDSPIGTSEQIVSSTITSCIDNVVGEELKTLGQSGGTINFEGVSSAVVDLGERKRRVLYGITQNKGGDGLLPRPYSAPRYPDWGVLMQNTMRNPETGKEWPSWSSGYFGDVSFRAVCSLTGTNRPGGKVACDSYPNVPPGTAGPSTQEELERRIEQRVQACASPTMLTDVTGQTVTRVHPPDVNITFTPTNIIVQLAYPLELHEKTVRSVSSFTRSYAVRYMGIVRFARDIAREDTRNVLFNIGEDYKDVVSYKPEFTVLRANNVQLEDQTEGLHAKADLITIIDSGSTLDGVTYMFNFLVEHRLPMVKELSEDEFAQIAYNTSILEGHDPDDSTVVVDVCDSCDPKQIRAIDADGDKDWQLFP